MYTRIFVFYVLLLLSCSMYIVHAILIRTRRMSYYIVIIILLLYIHVPPSIRGVCVCVLVIGNRIRRQTIVRVINMRATATAAARSHPFRAYRFPTLPLRQIASTPSPVKSRPYLGMIYYCPCAGILQLRVGMLCVCVWVCTPLVLNHCAPLPYTCAAPLPRRRHHVRTTRKSTAIMHLLPESRARQKS